MTDEKLIEDAAKAMYRITNQLSMSGARDLARAAFAAFENAKPRELPDQEVDAEGDRAERENSGSRPQLGGLLPRPIAISDLDGTDGPGAVLGSRAPVVVLADGASSLAAVTTRTTPDRSGDHGTVRVLTEQEGQSDAR